MGKLFAKYEVRKCAKKEELKDIYGDKKVLWIEYTNDPSGPLLFPNSIKSNDERVESLIADMYKLSEGLSEEDGEEFYYDLAELDTNDEDLDSAFEKIGKLDEFNALLEKLHAVQSDYDVTVDISWYC